MKSPFVRGLVIGVALALAIAGGIYAWLEGGRPLPAVIPADVADEMVPIKTERDVDEEQPTAVESVRVVTRPGHADPAAVRALALQLCGSTSHVDDADPGAPFTPASSPEPVLELQVPEIHARVSFDATKHVGLDESKKHVIAGWVGSAKCETAPAADGPWSTLFEAPFDQSTSIAVSELRPEQMIAPRALSRIFETGIGITSDPGLRAELRRFGHGRRWGLWIAADYVPDPEELTAATFDLVDSPYFDDDDRFFVQSGVTTESGSRWVFAGGIARRWGKP